MKALLKLKKHAKGMFKKGVQWIAVTNDEGKKDWIQVGKKNKTFGKLYTK